MARRKGSRDRQPRKRKSFRPLRSPEAGPDLPRVEAQACDCLSLIKECQDALCALSQTCSQPTAQPSPLPQPDW